MQSLQEGIDEKLTCAHCGDDCEDRRIASGEDVFCCLGCKTVYEVLHENGMDAYYRIEDEPGISLKHSRGRDYFNFLDNPDIRRRILDFEGPRIARVRLYIPSIHCSSCIWLLENLYRLQVGVNKSEVNFPKKEIYIDFDPPRISLRELVEFLASLGYEPDISLEGNTKERSRRTDHNRSLLIRVGVAGFCFGNIMLFSFPEYLGLERLIDGDFSRFFSYIIILLSIPVVAYSASGYFQAAFKGLKQKVVSIDVPIAIGIVTLFLRSVYEIAVQTGPGYLDSLSGLVFFLLIGKWFQNRTYENLLFDRNYKSYFPIAVTRLNGGTKESVMIENLKEGDRILIRNGELIPSDSELISQEACIDNSFVTGESEPLKRKKGEYIFAGGRQVGAAIELEVQKEVSQSYLTQLWNNETFKGGAVKSRRILVDKISKYFTVAVLGIAVLASLYWFLFDPSKVINVFTAVLIVACPCALALSTPFAVGTAMRILGRNGCYIKNGDVIEGLKKVDHVVFDKTGTITFNDKEEGTLFRGNLGNKEAQMAELVASNSFHPLSRRISKFLKNKFGSSNDLYLEEFHEHVGKGLQALVNGKEIRLGSQEFVVNQSDTNVDNALSRVFLSVEGSVIGFFELRSNYRGGLKEVVDKLGEEKVLSVLSGDKPTDKRFLTSIFPENTEIKFEQSIYDKLDFIKNQQEGQSRVLMVGDGLNDSGALAQADIGIAISEDVNNFTPASDVILAGKEFGKLPAILRFASATVSIIIISFIISFLYNVIGIGFAVFGMLTPVLAAILMPLSSISVVFFTTIAVSLIASRLGFK